jgi:hypothetical protein
MDLGNVTIAKIAPNVGILGMSGSVGVGTVRVSGSDKERTLSTGRPSLAHSVTRMVLTPVAVPAASAPAAMPAGMT